eukprot:SAG11_NODE_110_length_16199_cov_18.081180_2_plen_67_part_00
MDARCGCVACYVAGYVPARCGCVACYVAGYVPGYLGMHTYEYATRQKCHTPGYYCSTSYLYPVMIE